MKIDMSHVPNGQSGAWRVSTFTVTKEEAKLESMRAMFGGGRGCPAGTFKRLCRGNTVVMSNTPDEIRDHSEFLRVAKGNVLIHGLGLGMCATFLIDEACCDRMTIVEKSEDVIALVGPAIESRATERGAYVDIVHADAYEWSPPKGVRYDAVWHDIWDTLCADNLPDMTRLHRRYGRRTDWQGSWGKEWIQRNARRSAGGWR